MAQQLRDKTHAMEIKRPLKQVRGRPRTCSQCPACQSLCKGILRLQLHVVTHTGKHAVHH